MPEGALIVAKGIAQGCAVHTAKYVVDRGALPRYFGPRPHRAGLR